MKMLVFLCGNYGDDIGHHFLHYRLITTLWYQVSSIWGFYFVSHLGVTNLFDCWAHLDIFGQKLQIWELAFIILAWFTWKARNRTVVKWEQFDGAYCFEMFRFYLTWWFKEKWGHKVSSIANIFRFLGEVSLPLGVSIQPVQFKIEPTYGKYSIFLF